MKNASFIFVTVISTIVSTVLSSLIACSSFGANGGWLRDRIKARIVKKADEQPAPVASTDVTAKIDKPGDTTFSIKQGETTRYYIVHVPKSYSTAKAAPLLVVLHGGGGNMTLQATDEYYKQISKSEQIGFIAVFPNGVSKFKSGALATWNAGFCCAKARDENVDDVGFIRQIVKNVSQQLNIDSKRVFATGMSNGAMMAYRLACEAPDVFKAIAAVAGTDNTKTCTPKTPIAILHIHAKDDDRVPIAGHAGKSFGDDTDAITDFVSVPATIEKWTKKNGCEAKPKNVLQVKGASCERYANCKPGATVELCLTDVGGHSWPGGKKPRMGASPSNAISANDVMWDFFNREVK